MLYCGTVNCGTETSPRPRPLARMLPTIVLAAAWAGCVAPGGTEPNRVDVSGRWSFVEQFTDVPHQVSCADTGSYFLTQTAAGFSGVYGQRGVCTGPFGKVDNADSGSVTEGRVVGRTVRFKAPNCEYAGSVPVETEDRLAGQVVCSIGDSTITYSFSGSWSATR